MASTETILFDSCSFMLKYRLVQLEFDESEVDIGLSRNIFLERVGPWIQSFKSYFF